MDKLLLLDQGKVIYYGDANKIVQYMEDIGIKINYKMNPADFFMYYLSNQTNKIGGGCALLNAANFQKKKNNYIQTTPNFKELK